MVTLGQLSREEPSVKVAPAERKATPGAARLNPSGCHSSLTTEPITKGPRMTRRGPGRIVERLLSANTRASAMPNVIPSVAMNGHAPRYAIVLSDLRAEVIRVLVEHPRELSAAVLTQRLRHRFPWYQWFGN